MRSRIRQISLDGVLAAMCAVLGCVSLDFGNFKFTFESLPIIIGALLFGPADGALIGFIGTLIYQLLKWGAAPTLPLWVIPYAVCGLICGAAAKKHGFKLDRRQTIIWVTVSQLILTLLNTVSIYLDAKIMGYYSFAYVFGSFGVRIVVCVLKSIAFGAVLPVLIKRIKDGGLLNGN